MTSVGGIANTDLGGAAGFGTPSAIPKVMESGETANVETTVAMPPPVDMTASTAGAASTATASTESDATSGDVQTVDPEAVRKAAARLNRVLEVSDKELRFAVREDTGRQYIEIFNKDTGDLVKTIPPESLMAFQARFEDMLGLLYDSKV